MKWLIRALALLLILQLGALAGVAFFAVAFSPSPPVLAVETQEPVVTSVFPTAVLEPASILESLPDPLVTEEADVEMAKPEPTMTPEPWIPPAYHLIEPATPLAMETLEPPNEPIEPIEPSVPAFSGTSCKTALMVLMFHRVPAAQSEVSKSYLSVWLKDFEAMLDWLVDNDYHTATAEELYQFVTGQICLPERSVVLTFDDGYDDWPETVYPALRDRGLHGILYLIAGRIPYSTELIREMETSGAVEIQSHLLTHRTAYGLGCCDLWHELAESKRILEEVTGHEIAHLAWPGGNYNAHVMQLAAETGYRTAVRAWGDSTRIIQGDDHLELPRICVGAADSLQTFIEKVQWRTYSTTSPRC